MSQLVKNDNNIFTAMQIYKVTIFKKILIETN